MRFLTKFCVLCFVALFVVSGALGQDLTQQKQELLGKIREIDKQLADNPSPQEYEDLINQRKKIEGQIKDVTSKLMADAETVKKINAVKKAYNDGNNAYKLGNYQEAVGHYDRATSMDSTFYKAYYGKGLAYNKLRKYKEAIIAHQASTRQNPSYVEAYIALGKIYKKVGQVDAAITVFSSAVKNNPAAEKAYYELGAAYLDNKKDYNKAAMNFTRATQLDPEYALAYYSLGVSLTELGRYGDALLALDNAIDSASRKRWHAPHYRKAVIYNKQGAYSKAKTAADEALKHKRNYAPAAYEAGKASKELGQFTQAVTYFKICQNDRQWKRMGDYEIDLIVNRDKYGGN